MDFDAFHAYDRPDQLHQLKARHPTYADVQYAAVEGYRPLLLDLTLPADRSSPVPVVVCIHGGAWLTGSNKATHDDYVDYPAVWDALLARGLAVASIQYRHSGEASFPAQLHDVKAAVRWLRHFADDIGIDPSEIGVWGESAGGHLALLLAMNTTATDLEGSIGVTGINSGVQAAVAWYPPTDLASMQSQMPEHSAVRHDAPDSPETLLLGESGNPVRQMLDWASPFAHASINAAPVLLIHGEADTIVPFQQSESLHTHMRTVGADSRLVPVSGADHCLVGVDRRPYIDATVDELADRLL